ncbi:hypothetical protein DBV15_01313 [Temnothorax longispinosus]|uniref:Uncharacterized protein n=1 Tax=Temnothorax longispinosus TaxID=300112 RepID=A0A4S2KJB8_9HYME|nr:hypothetical protein DBV15_01313 [Temnothorax longispinosus]
MVSASQATAIISATSSFLMAGQAQRFSCACYNAVGLAFEMQFHLMLLDMMVQAFGMLGHRRTIDRLHYRYC